MRLISRRCGSVKLQDRVAFITGGGGYIGYHTALRLASDGARIAVCDISREAVERAVSGIASSGGDAFGVVADVADPQSIDDAVQQTIDLLGRIDILVHAAGGSARSRIKDLVDQTDDVIREIIGVNLLGGIFCARAAARNMIQNKSGRIICVASTNGVMGNKGLVEYSASKGGLIAMTRALAKEIGQYGITVNCVSPGLVPRPDEYHDASHTNVLRVTPTAGDLVGLIAFLASDEASFITGQNYIVDGGRSIALKGTD